MAATRDLAGDPPDSTRLRIGDDIAWSDVGGVYDRDDSLKENTNPKCILKNYNGGGGGGGSSQRFSGNLKSTAAPIIGMPGKLGGGGGGGGRRHHHHHHPPAMFPKKARTGGGGRSAKTAVPEHEPSSPKVSCIGKVLSDRERARRRRPPAAARSAPEMGCCPGFGFLIRRSRSRKGVVECVDQSPPPPPPPISTAATRRRQTMEVETADEAAAPAPGLGGMMRFSSGRRAADWAAEMEPDGHVSKSGPL